MADIIDFSRFVAINEPRQPVDPEAQAVMQAVFDMTYKRVFARTVLYGETWNVAQAEIFRQIAEED